MVKSSRKNYSKKNIYRKNKKTKKNGKKYSKNNKINKMRGGGWYYLKKKYKTIL